MHLATGPSRGEKNRQKPCLRASSPGSVGCNRTGTTAMPPSADRQQPSLSTAGYIDGLGRRTLRFDREVGGMLQALELRPEFSLFEPLIREAAGRIASIQDARVAGIVAIQRQAHGLVVCSPLVAGDRLEELLEARSADEEAGPGLDAALGFLVRIIPAVSLLHSAGIVHGLLAPGRLALTASGDVVLLDCTYAGAVERMRLSQRRLWTSFGIAPASGFDRAADLRQIALTAVAIALGRPLEEPCTPPVIARLLEELTEVAQIRAGERFALDFCALLETAARLAPAAPAALDDIGAEAHRLARALGMGGCVAALTALAGVRGTAGLPTAPSVIDTPMVLRQYEAPAVVEPETFPEADEEPELSLDVKDTVEISLDDTGGLDFEAPEEPGVLVLDASDADSALFDWQPDAIGMVKRPEQSQTTAIGSIATDSLEAPAEPAQDWLAPAAATATTEELAPAATPHVEASQPDEPTDPILPAVEPVAPPILEVTQPPVEAASLQPAPPPGIPIFRQPALQPTPPAGSASRTQPAEERGGLKLYVPPPPRPAPPVPIVHAPVEPPRPAATISAPAPVVVVAPAPLPSAPLRLKESPPVPARPRRMLEPLEDDGFEQRRAGRSAEASKRAPWKLVAAAAVLLAAGAFAGLPFVTSGTEPAAAEAAAVAPTAPPAPASAAGALRIETQPSGASVLLDGEDVGRTPLELNDIKPGRHTITLSTDSTTVKRTVRIEAGKTVTLDVPVYSGWVAVYSPIPLHISEGSRMLGTTETTRVMLSPGRHELTLTNREHGYSSKQTVDIVAGEERVLNIEPKGSISVNALPWAEVWIDGTRMGETPLANLEVPLGTREFVFKHPTYGERRLTTTITSKSPPLSVDFTRPGTRP
jgi:hypothetical protein